MGEGLNNLLQKLGHELEEIRVRALENIISKLDRGLLTPDTLLDQPDLFQHLVNWFKFPTNPCKSLVLELILRLCREDRDGSQLLLRYDPNLKTIFSSISRGEEELFKELCQLSNVKFSELENSFEKLPKKFDQVPSLNISKNISDGCVFSYDSLEKSVTLTNWSTLQNSKNSPISENRLSNDSFKEVSWSCPQLDQGDASVLNTVYSSLRDTEQSSQAVYFFTTVVLHDFPPQVFLHNTAIISALFDLITVNSRDDYVNKCFQSLIEALIKYYTFRTDPVIISTNVSKKSVDSSESQADENALSSYPTNKIISLSTKAPLSVENFCGLVLERLGVDTPGLLALLSLCIPDFNSFWSDSNSTHSDLKQRIISTLTNLATKLNNSKSLNAITRLETQLSVYKILKYLVPIDASAVILTKDLQEAIARTLLDPTLYLLFPEILKLFLNHVQKFQCPGEILYNEYDEVGKSLEAGAKFLNHSDDMNSNEVMCNMKSSLIGLEFHQQYRTISLFFELVTSKYELEASELETAQEIVLLLLSSADDHIRSSTYETCSEVISKLLGPNKCISKDDPLPRLSCIVNCTVLTEIISFGLTNQDRQICKWSESILTLILKCQILVNPVSWRWLLHELHSVFSILQAFCASDSILGQTVVSFFDPDISKLIHLNELQVITSNLRFMFSKHSSSHEEGKMRILYLLNIPAKHVLDKQSFSFAEDPLQGVENPPCNYPEESLVRVLEVVCTCPDDDRALIKSALTQLSVLTEDFNLHISFLDHDGLPLTIKHLYECIDSLEEDSLQLFTPSIVILKNLARHNNQLRLDFSLNTKLFTYILKGFFLFNAERRLLRDVAQLLALMAYADVILTTPELVSFPDVLVSRIRIPFKPVSHAKVSQHTIPSKKSRLLSNKAVIKSLSLRWSVALCKNGIDEAITSNLKDLPQAPLLVVSLQSLNDLRESHIPHNMRSLLDSLLNARSHKSALDALNLLRRYLHMKEVLKNSSELNNLPWECSFLRYLTTLPASVSDQMLLVAILRFLTDVLGLLPAQKKWISTIFVDPTSVLCSLMTQILVADTTPLDKELSVELLSLLDACLDIGFITWDHTLKILIQCLTQSHTHKFYSLAIMDKLLKCLLKLASQKLPFAPKPIWQLLNAFHCTSPDSYMGITITRSTILCLCILLSLRSDKNKSKEWLTAECKWIMNLLSSRDLIVRSATMELLSGICYDSSTTTAIVTLLPSLWHSVLKILLDHNESSLAREQAAALCSNIVATTEDKGLIKDCIDSGLFGCLAILTARMNFHPSVDEISTFHNFMVSSFSTGDEETVSSISTPNLLTACCNLVMNLIFKDKDEVKNHAWSQGFILELFRQVTKWRSFKVVCSQDIVDMLSTVFELLVHFTKQTSATVKDCLPVLVLFLQTSTYTPSLDRSRLSVNTIHLIGSIVDNQDVHVLLTKEAMDTICSVVSNVGSPLLMETAVSIAHLAPFLTPEANKELLCCLKVNSVAERTLLAGVLGVSHAGTQAALKQDLLKSLVGRLREAYVELAVVPPDIPRNKKANSALYNLWIDINLLTNFLAGCVEAKEKCAQLGLADAIHKVWAWCLLDVALLRSLLQALINFTADCLEAASTLVLTSTMAGVGQRKTPTSNSLLHAVLSLLNKDIYGNDVKKSALELMIHSCQAQECRIVLNKSSVLNDFLKLGNLKKTNTSEELEVAWLEFLEVYSSYVDGQTTIMKNEDVLNYISSFISSNKLKARMLAISVIRNLIFNPSNKQKFIASDKILKCLSELLLEEKIEERELQDVLLIAWNLAANSQRGKNSIKNAGFISRLKLVFCKNSYSDLKPIYNNFVEVIK